MVSGLLWGFLSDRLGRRTALLWNNGIISAGSSPAALLPSAVLPHYLHVSLRVDIHRNRHCHCRIHRGPGGEKRASLYGLVTLIHGIGQLIGTTSGGYLKDLTHSFQWTLTASLAGFLLCFILIVLNKKREDEKAPTLP